MAWINTEKMNGANESQERNATLLESVIQSDVVAISVYQPIINEGFIIDFEWVMTNSLQRSLAQGQNLVGKRLLDVFPQALQNGTFDTMKKVWESGQREIKEVHYHDHYTTGWYRNVYVKSADYIILNSEDITATKKAEHDVKETKQALEAAFNVSTSLLFILTAIRDEQGILVDFLCKWTNNTAIKFMGKDITGFSILETFNELNRNGLLNQLSLPLRDNQPVYFETNIERSGEEVWLRWKISKLDDGVFVSVDNITEARAAAAEKLKNFEILRQSEEIAEIGSWEFEIKSQKMTWSDGMYRIFGLERGLPVTPETYLKVASKDSYETAARIVQQIRKGTSSFEETLLIKSGKVKSIKVKCSAIKDENGKVTRMVGVDFDISALEESIKLKEINQKLRELDKEKTKFFNNVSHEFRTPLTLLLSPLEELIRAGKEGMITMQDVPKMEMVYRNAIRLQKLVNTLLDFARIESGKVEAVFQPTDIVSYTADLVASFRSATEKAGLKLIFKPVDITEPVYLNREMWEKIILNLLSNAFKFTEHGKIEVIVRAKKKFVQVTVKDTGYGISHENLPRIFERFVRIEGQKARTHEGTGIGLALVKELIALHGGTIKVKSTVGYGSEFIVSIPRGKTHLPAKQIFESTNRNTPLSLSATFAEEASGWLPEDRKRFASKIVRGQRADRKRALAVLADDNADMRTYLTHILENDFNIISVENGARVLEVLQRGVVPDIILTDVMMPGIDGLQLVSALKQHHQFSRIPVVLVSAKSGGDSRVEAMQYGADDYIVKPFSSSELKAILIARIEKSRRLIERGEVDITSMNETFEGRVRDRLSEETKQILQRQHEQLQKILDAIPQMVLVIDSTFRIRYLNERWYSYTGLVEEQCIDQYPDRFGIYHPRQEGEVAMKWHTCKIANKRFVGEFLIKDKHGNFRWHLDITEPIFNNGEVEMWVITYTDVHEQFSTEYQIQETKNLLQAVFDSTTNAISFFEPVLNVEGEIIDFRWKYYNKKAEEFTGTRDLVGKRLKEQYPYIEKGGVLRKFIEVVQTGVAMQFEHAFRRGDGKTWFLTVANKLGDGLVITQQDITEQVNSRQGLVRLSGSLQQKNLELNAANEELSNFAFIASHDLREPLRKIRLFSNLLLERKDDAIKARSEEYIHRILMSVHRMNALIDDILTFSKTSTLPKKEFTDVNLNVILENVLEDLSELIKESNAIIRHGELPTIKGNALQLSQLFQNLVSNAIKFQPRGKNPEVILANEIVTGKDIPSGMAKRDTNYLKLSVRDNGIGFDMRFYPKIFNMFQRLHSKDEYPGTGMGLAICKRVIENHKGFIFAEGKENEGSVFTCYFPME